VAWSLLHSTPPKKDDASTELLSASEAAAQEAAALGPQLCIILALADSPGHAYLWQNVAYIASAVAFAAAIAACGQSPPKMGSAAIPPGVFEIFVCSLLNVAACLALVMCFPHLNTWHLWVLLALMLGLLVAIRNDACREIVVELLEPLLAMRSDADKTLPGAPREKLRGSARIATTVCAAVALWDILLHPLPEGLFEAPAATEPLLGSDLPELWDPSSMMLLRWLPGLEQPPGEQELLASAAEAIKVEVSKLTTQVFASRHRMLLFKAVVAEHPPAHMRWKAAKLAPSGRLASLLDADFPATLNVTLCLHAHAAVEHHKADGREPVLPVDFKEIVGSSREVQRAYMSGCDWWSQALDAHYGHRQEEEQQQKQQEPQDEGIPAGGGREAEPISPPEEVPSLEG